VYSYKRNGKFYPQKKEQDFPRLPKPIRDLFEPIIARVKDASPAPGLTDHVPEKPPS